jgi:hypothetical protein
MAHPGESAATIIVIVVSIVSLVMAAIAVRSLRRTGNRRLAYVASAFATFAVKGVVVAWALQSSTIQHEHLEVVSALFDLVTIVLLVIPIFR